MKPEEGVINDEDPAADAPRASTDSNSRRKACYWLRCIPATALASSQIQQVSSGGAAWEVEDKEKKNELD